MTLEPEPLGPASFDDRYRILGGREEAMDVAQEALARAQQRWSRLGDRPDGWVARVAANQAIGVWRKRQRRPSPGPSPAADHVDEHAAQRLDLVRALHHLPRRQREVVVLRYLADRPEAEVAHVLGCSIGSVKTHAHRGLSAMRAELGGT